jgi:Flp pilus assembly protein CpaB
VSNRRTLLAAAAVVLALVAGFGVFSYVSHADRRAEDRVGFVPALVANADIAKGTTGEEVLQAGLVKMERVARGSIPSSIFTDAGQLKGTVASTAVGSKQFITRQTFVAPTDGGAGPLASAIARKDLVAITVSFDQERGVANEVAPGDHVNMVLVSEKQVGYLLQNVKVLAVGATTITAASQGAPAATSGVLTFELSASDALAVIAAQQTGNIYLMLLPPTASSTSTSGTAGARGATTTTTVASAAAR